MLGTVGEERTNLRRNSISQGSAKNKTWGVSSTIIQHKVVKATLKDTRKLTKTRTLINKQFYILYQLDNGNDYIKVFRCVWVCKTRILSVKLNACICVNMSELKREDRLVFTYVCVCLGMYEPFGQLSNPLWVLAGHLASIYRAVICLSADLSLFELKTFAINTLG